MIDAAAATSLVTWGIRVGITDICVEPMDQQMDYTPDVEEDGSWILLDGFTQPKPEAAPLKRTMHQHRLAQPRLVAPYQVSMLQEGSLPQRGQIPRFDIPRLGALQPSPVQIPAVSSSSSAWQRLEAPLAPPVLQDTRGQCWVRADQQVLTMSSSSMPSSLRVDGPVNSVRAKPHRLPQKGQQILRVRHASASPILVQKWFALLNMVQSISNLWHSISMSDNWQLHAKRVLDCSAPTTALKYITSRIMFCALWNHCGFL